MRILPFGAKGGDVIQARSWRICCTRGSNNIFALLYLVYLHSYMCIVVVLGINLIDSLCYIP